MTLRFSVAALLGIVVIPAALGQVSDEYGLKAAFLYKLTKFVEWPAQSFQPGDPLVICVLGKNPFGSALKEAVQGKTAQDRPLAVEAIEGAGKVCACHVLFVSSSERKHLPSIMAATAAKDILTVGDTDSFIAGGGAVNLRLEEGKIRIEINPGAAETHHLKISSKLLSLAEIRVGAK